MKSNRSLLGVIGIVAAAVIIYFGFFNAPPADDHLQATVGTVAKHVNEQISDEDVVLAGEETTDWSDDPVVVEAMASILERATIAQRSYAYLATGRKERVDLLMGANAETKAAVLGRVDVEKQVAAFNLLGKKDREAILGRMNINSQAFKGMNLDLQGKAIAGLAVHDQAMIMGRVDKNYLLGAVAKGTPAMHSEILGRASKHQLARAFMAAPDHNRMEMFKDLPLNERQSMLGRVSAHASSGMLHRATPVEMENLRNSLSVENAANLYAASSVQDQLVWAGRAVKTAPDGFETFGRQIKQDTFGRLFLQATAKEKVAFFRAQPVDVQNELHGKMNINKEAWDGMDLNGRAKALTSLPLERQAKMLAAVDKAMVIDLARHAKPEIQKDFVAGLSRVEKADALRLGASSREFTEALGRKPEIRNAVFADVAPDVQIRMMGRMVRDSSIE